MTPSVRPLLAALPWYHPRRLREDTACCFKLLLLGAVYGMAAALRMAGALLPTPRRKTNGHTQSASSPPSEEEKDEGGRFPRGVRGTVTLPVQATGWAVEKKEAATGEVAGDQQKQRTEGEGEEKAKTDTTFEMSYESYPTYPAAVPAHDPVSTRAPTVVLLNSTGGSAACWVLSGAVNDLRHRGYNVLLCDLRGQGRTGVPPGPYTVNQLALDVAALLRSRCSDPVHVIGYSIGAAVALQLAVLDAMTCEKMGAAKTSQTSQHGSIVRSIVLFGFTSSFRDGKTKLQRLVQDVITNERFVRTLGVRAYGQLLAVLMGYNWGAINANGGYPRDSSSGGGDPMQGRQLDTNGLARLQADNNLDGFAWTVASWTGFDVTAALPAVECPVLHVHVSGDDRAGHTFEKKHADMVALKHGHLTKISGPYSHGLPWENTAKFIAVAAEFMDNDRAHRV